ncbi:unnamed protein product [Sphagnum balticum]
MKAKIHCPYCQEALNETELKKLWAEYCGSKKSASKAAAAKKNGAKGGRPMNYLQDMYDAIPDSILLFQEKLKNANCKGQFAIQRIDTDDPIETGFDVLCDDRRYHCFWDGRSEFISILENGTDWAGINRKITLQVEQR